LAFWQLHDPFTKHLLDASDSSISDCDPESDTSIDAVDSHGEGDRASRAALNADAYLAIRYGNWNVRVDTETAPAIRKGLQRFFHLSDKALRQASRKFPGSRLTTSLMLSVVAGADLFFANVGQSKAFLFRAGTLIPLTSDHLDPLVTNAIGNHPDDADVAIKQVQMVADDRLLLCTNGLTDVVRTRNRRSTRRAAASL
jgi:serine/threonine protein phosphatase PrpC